MKCSSQGPEATQLIALFVGAFLLISNSVFAQSGQRRPLDGSSIEIGPGANIQSTINSAALGTTIVFASGTYNITSVIVLKSGVSLKGRSGAILHSNGSSGIFKGLGVSDITISGFVIDGNDGGPGQVAGAIYLDSSTGIDTTGNPSSNIKIIYNTFQNWANTNVFYLWASNNTYIQGNTINDSWQGLSWSSNPGDNLDTLVISDNRFSGIQRYGIEVGFGGIVTNLHIDRNVIGNMGEGSSGSISLVAGSAATQIGPGTMSGNQIDGATGNAQVELGDGSSGSTGMLKITVERNRISNVTKQNDITGMMFAHAEGCAVLQNTFINVMVPFGQDGGFDDTQWIGTNTVNGVAWTGWPRESDGQGPYPNRGAEPTLYSPSGPPPPAP